MEERSIRSRQHSAQRRPRFPRLRTLGEGLRKAVFATVLCFSLALNSPSSTVAKRDFTPPAAARTCAVSSIDWRSTHVLIINGDIEGRHMGNAQRAAEAALKQGAAGISVAGLMEREFRGVKRYMADAPGIRKMLEQAKGGKILLYITGHGDKDNSFVLENDKKIAHGKLLGLLEYHLKGREVIFVSDACYSANFVNLIVESKRFKSTLAMSPGLSGEETSCNYFSNPFWHALANNIDLDGNNVASLEEAFRYGLKKYREFRSDTIGTFRKSIRRISSLDEVKDGLIMVTSEWCGPCNAMKPIFNTLNLFAGGTLNFYLIDVSNVKHISGTPTFLILRQGSTIAWHVGFLPMAELRKWMNSNGAGIRDFEVPIRQLYVQGKYESIAAVFDLDEILRGVGESKTVNLLSWLLRSNNDEMAERGKFMLADVLGKKPQVFVPHLESLLRSKNPMVRKRALSSLSFAAKKRKLDVARFGGILQIVRRNIREKDAGMCSDAISILSTTLSSIDAPAREELLAELGNLLSQGKNTADVILALKAFAAVADISGHKRIESDIKKIFEGSDEEAGALAGKTLAVMAKRNTMGVIPYLVDLLGAKDENIQERSLKTLEEISRNQDLSGYPNLDNHLMMSLKRPGSARTAIDILINLASRNPYKYNPLLVSLHKSRNRRLRMYGALAISGAISESEKKPAPKMKKDPEGGGLPLPRLARSAKLIHELIWLLKCKEARVATRAKFELMYAVKNEPEKYLPVLKRLLGSRDRVLCYSSAMALFMASIEGLDLKKYHVSEKQLNKMMERYGPKEDLRLDEDETGLDEEME